MAIDKFTQDAIDHNWYVKAIDILTPRKTHWRLTDDNVLTWGGEEDQPEGFVPPTLDEIQAKADELRKQWEDSEYQRLRAVAYPPVTDYLDAIVKGDTAAQQAYIDACLAIKEQFPKP